MTGTLSQRHGSSTATPDAPVHSALDTRERLAILERLQTSLDLEQLITAIYEQIQQHVPVDGLEFRHEMLGLQCLSGSKAPHSCGYRLVQTDDNAGELIFRRHQTFREQELARLEELIPLCFGPLRNALYFRAAMDRAFRDPISGARNQRGLWQILPREIALARRHKRPLSGILFDMHDQTGTAANDSTIRTAVTQVSGLCRETDMIFRVGDDTFLLLLQETDEDAAALFADHLLKICDTWNDGQSGRVDVRLACITASGADTADSFINRGSNAIQRSPLRGLCVDERRNG